MVNSSENNDNARINAHRNARTYARNSGNDSCLARRGLYIAPILSSILYLSIFILFHLFYLFESFFSPVVLPPAARGVRVRVSGLFLIDQLTLFPRVIFSK